MPAQVFDGRAFAKAKNRETAEAIQAHLAAAGRPPRLDVLLVGADEASAVYVRNKERTGDRIGMETRVHRLPADLGAAQIATALVERNADPEVDGIVLQLPLPGGVDPRPLLNAIDPAKDVDGFHPVNAGQVLSGGPGGFAPATPLGIDWILGEVHGPMRGTDVCIVSHSNLIGKPLAAMLLNQDATVTVCHKDTRDLQAHTRQAEVLVTGAGVPGLITGAHVAPGAVVIDAATVLGDDGTLRGDCVADEVAEQAAVLTPVPGGVGPVTVAALLHNVMTAWRRRTTGHP